MRAPLVFTATACAALRAAAVRRLGPTRRSTRCCWCGGGGLGARRLELLCIRVELRETRPQVVAQSGGRRVGRGGRAADAAARAKRRRLRTRLQLRLAWIWWVDMWITPNPSPSPNPHPNPHPNPNPDPYLRSHRLLLSRWSRERGDTQRTLHEPPREPAARRLGRRLRRDQQVRSNFRKRSVRDRVPHAPVQSCE